MGVAKVADCYFPLLTHVGKKAADKCCEAATYAGTTDVKVEAYKLGAKDKYDREYTCYATNYMYNASENSSFYIGCEDWYVTNEKDERVLKERNKLFAGTNCDKFSKKEKANRHGKFSSCGCGGDMPPDNKSLAMYGREGPGCYVADRPGLKKDNNRTNAGFVKISGSCGKSSSALYA